MIKSEYFGIYYDEYCYFPVEINFGILVDIGVKIFISMLHTIFLQGA
jgi:hypothetical protein